MEYSLLNEYYKVVGQELLKEMTEDEMQLSAYKLRMLLDQNRFPDWVVDSWIDDNKKKAIPLRNGYWLRTYYVTTSDDDNHAIWYAGEMVDEHGKVAGGVMTININDEDDVDVKTIEDLEKFKREFKRREELEVYQKVPTIQKIKDLEMSIKKGEKAGARLDNPADNMY